MTKTYDDKVKMSKNFQKGQDVLVEFDSVQEPKENPFKTVSLFINIFQKINHFLIEKFY